MLLRVPVGMAMGLVGVTGFGYLVGGAPALKLVGQTSMRTVTDYTFGIIPMFLLMGQFSSRSGMSRELFQAANAFFGHVRGGLGLATIAACGGFAAISGSSVATAATFSTIAYPEMRRYGYPQSFATGVIAAGGTLGRHAAALDRAHGLRPHHPAGHRPAVHRGGAAGRARGFDVYDDHRAHRPAAPEFSADADRGVPGPSGSRVCATYGRRSCSSSSSSAGSMAACSRRPRRRAWARAAPFIIGIARRRLSRADIVQALLGATRTAAAVFTVLIGALLFGYFLTVTQTPQKVTEFLTGLGLGRYGVLVLIMLMYLVLGCLMDAMAMIILTIPVIFPVITALGFDPIWFGIIIVMTVELGLIHPPVGMNVFVIKSVVQDVKFSTIFLGVIPFVITDIVRLAILIAFPIIATFLPSRMG